MTTSEVSLDVGVVQANSVVQDVPATRAAVDALLARRSALVAAERSFLRAVGASCVLSDIPALPLVAAAQEGVPSVAMSNFSWDWIYEELSMQHQALAFAEDYAYADVLLRLPFHGGTPACRAFRRVEDVPLVARHASHEPRYTRRCLGVDTQAPLVLVTFGGLGPGAIAWNGLAALRDYRFVVTPPAPPLALDHVHVIDNARLRSEGLCYADLVAASDVVVSKPGYGIVSECIANETRLLYTSRGRFAEYPVLVEGLRQYAVSDFIPPEYLERGAWEPFLRALLDRPPKPPAIPINGADEVVIRLAAALSAS